MERRRKIRGGSPLVRKSVDIGYTIDQRIPLLLNSDTDCASHWSIQYLKNLEATHTQKKSRDVKNP